MKYIIERQDFQKTENIKVLSKKIFETIKLHFIDVLTNENNTNENNNLIGEKPSYNKLKEKLSKISYPNFTIVIESGNSISFGYHVKKKEFFLFLTFDSLIDFIDEIIIHPEKMTKDTNLYSLLSKYEKLALAHELTHFKDNEIFDIFKTTLHKIIRKPRMSIDDKQKYIINNQEEYYRNYFKIYNDLETEYNAFFVSALSEMKKHVEKNPNILSDFNSFNEKFLEYIHIQSNELYSKSKFRKHINKRIYDAFIKFKEELSS